MPRLKTQDETHLATRIGWLRAAVLGANDGIISTSSLIVGVAAATPDKTAMLIAGVAGIVAGAMSMAAGEYVSVSSQADTENADLARKTRELKEQPEFELNEILWKSVRGADSPMPPPVRAAFVRSIPAEADENDDSDNRSSTTGRR